MSRILPANLSTDSDVYSIERMCHQNLFYRVPLANFHFLFHFSKKKIFFFPFFFTVFHLLGFHHSSFNQNFVFFLLTFFSNILRFDVLFIHNFIHSYFSQKMFPVFVLHPSVTWYTLYTYRKISIDWLIDWLYVSIDWLVHCAYALIDWLLLYILIDWLIDWLMHIQIYLISMDVWSCRYQVMGNQDDVVMRNVYVMLDLITFLDLMEGQEYRQALAIMKSINVIPLEQNGVGTAVRVRLCCCISPFFSKLILFLKKFT